jgi:hypothetical protein
MKRYAATIFAWRKSFAVKLVVATMCCFMIAWIANAACDKECEDCFFFGNFGDALCRGLYVKEPDGTEKSLPSCEKTAWVPAGDPKKVCDLAGDKGLTWTFDTCSNVCTVGAAENNKKDKGGKQKNVNKSFVRLICKPKPGS